MKFCLKSSAFVLGISLCQLPVARGQFLMDMVDTTKDLGRSMLGIQRKFDHVTITGYMQPQFQLAGDTGINSFSGGNFPQSSNSRFTLRRGRIRIDYSRFSKAGLPQVQFAFQFDGTERGVNIRDFWGRVWDPKWSVLMLSTGMFARPFGFEVNFSSSDREAPERGRMSQTLMKTERDLGAMLTYEPRRKSNPLYHLKFDLGVFNGQGLTAISDYDRFKDVISQLYWKPTNIAAKLWLSGGVSWLYGAVGQTGKYRYTEEKVSDHWVLLPDSSRQPGSRMPRMYYGANCQLKLNHNWGATELRGEYWRGLQTGTQFFSETPVVAIPGQNLYTRPFQGAFVTLLQTLVTYKNQLILKYDFYDPNRRVEGKEIDPATTNYTLADIRFNTYGFGFLRHLNENLKLLLYYDIVKNEVTSISHYDHDVKDNVLTCRLQFRF